MYAGTRPSEALVLIMGMASVREGKCLHIMVNDVQRAHFHAEAKRELYVDILKEDPERIPNLVG